MDATDEHARTAQSIRELCALADLTFKVAQLDTNTRSKDEQRQVDELIRVHFWKVTAHLHSIRRILAPCCDARILWDVSGVAALARPIMDAALGIAYWRDESQPDEKVTKHALHVMHEHARQVKLLKLIGSDKHEFIRWRLLLVEDVRRGICINPLFRGRLANRRNDALKAKLARLLRNDEIANRAGLNGPAFQAAWDVLSSHVHAHPHATSALRNFNAQDAASAQLLGLFVRYATMYASWATLQFIAHFPSSAGAMEPSDRDKATVNADVLYRGFGGTGAQG